MIIETILKGFLFLIKTLFSWLKAVLPVFSVPLSFSYFLSQILSICGQANNFIWFLLGDTAYVLMPSLIALITYKYLLYPIINLILSFFVNKAE